MIAYFWLDHEDFQKEVTYGLDAGGAEGFGKVQLQEKGQLMEREAQAFNQKANAHSACSGARGNWRGVCAEGGRMTLGTAWERVSWALLSACPGCFSST